MPSGWLLEARVAVTQPTPSRHTISTLTAGSTRHATTASSSTPLHDTGKGKSSREWNKSNRVRSWRRAASSRPSYACCHRDPDPDKQKRWTRGVPMAGRAAHAGRALSTLLYTSACDKRQITREHPKAIPLISFQFYTTGELTDIEEQISVNKGLERSANALPQWAQPNGFSPVCERMWPCSSHGRLNALLHTSHLCLRSWVSRCMAMAGMET
ncbi:hypothetical protein EYF80_026019 [Liparis tanakae]|uniref:Uncharacterized protein n=1 Tax=Liparis tanakae TaxID=230148 RepID=A0A4Z2HD62_9TELE|nr:hypothetical protein EYF80_026019 [Liparis tanakae]